MQKQTDLISVIIPVYNIEKYLRACIDSVLAQTYKNWELILIDDGATDSSGLICDEYANVDSRVKVFHQKNGGRSAARNAGLNSATGSFVMFVDGDDWIDPDCLEKAYVALSKHEASMAVFRCRNIYSDYVEDNSTDDKIFMEQSEPLEFYVKGHAGYQNFNAVWGKLYAEELLRDIRFVENKYYEDVMFMTKVYAACKRCVYLNQAYYNYNIATENSITFLGVNELTFRDEIPIFNEKEQFLRDMGRVDLAEEYAYFKFQRLLTYYRDCIEAGEKAYAKRIAEAVKQERDKVKYICNQEFVSAFYKLYLRIFLIQPYLGLMYEKMANNIKKR